MQIEPGAYEFRVVRVRKDDGSTEAVIPYYTYLIDSYDTLKSVVARLVESNIENSVGTPKVTYKRVKTKVLNDLN